MSVSINATIFEDTHSPVKHTALDIYRFSRLSRESRLIRCVSLSTKEVSTTHILSSERIHNIRTLRIGTDTEYEMECSADTEIWNGEGWVRADELQVGDRIWCNGSPDERYKDKEWLGEMLRKGYKQSEIARMCSTEEYPVSERTIRFWKKRLGLGDVGRSGGKVFGEGNPNWKGDVGEHALYSRARESFVKTGVCSVCGRVGRTDMHHKEHNLLASDSEDLEELCEGCHRSHHHGAVVKHTRPCVISFVRVGSTGDVIDIHTEEGNVVVSGFIVKG